jgi:Glycosyl transferase 4-like
MRITFIGPANVHLASWTRAFHDAGVDVALITCHRVQDFPPTVPVLELTSALPTRINFLRQIAALRREIAARNPDLVVAYYASSYGLLASLVCDQPYVVATAGSDVNLAAGRRPYLAPLVRRALNGAASIRRDFSRQQRTDHRTVCSESCACAGSGAPSTTRP